MNFGLIPTALGLTAALTWGAGDFSGGIAARRTSAYSVVIFAHLASLVLLLGAVTWLGEPPPGAATWLWGGAAGLFGGVGLMLLYNALASGQMSVAAPVSALVAAGIPVVVTIFTNGLPVPLLLIGFALALAAIWLVSGGAANFRPADLRLPLIAGVAFGFFFLTLHRASGSSILYPIIAVRIVSITSLLGYALLTRQPILPSRDSWLPIFMSGLFDTFGNSAYALSAQLGRVDVAVVLGSLYPGSTVLLAWAVLKEHISRKQMLGIVAALAAIVLITM